MEQKDKQPALTPEEIKAIGEIEIGPAKHEVFLNNHYKKLLAGILIAGIGAGLGIAYYSNTEEDKATASSLIVESINSTEDSANATILKDFIETPSASTAKLLSAMKMMQGANTEQAIKDLQALAASASDITISSRAAATVANYYMAESMNDKAIETWKQVANMPNNTYTALAYLNLGDLSKLAGDKEAARTYYTAIQQKCETSALIDGKDVEMRLMMLDVDAPKPVEPKATPSTPDTTGLPDIDIPNVDELPTFDDKATDTPAGTPSTPTTPTL